MYTSSFRDCCANKIESMKESRLKMNHFIYKCFLFKLSYKLGKYKGQQKNDFNQDS